MVRDGDLTAKQRNALLAEMTDEVGRLVLRDNYEQNIPLGNARVQAHSMLHVHERLHPLAGGARRTSTGRWSSCPPTRQIRRACNAPARG